MSNSTEITRADREMLIELFDIPSITAAALLRGEYDDKKNIVEKLQALARHRTGEVSDIAPALMSERAPDA